MLFRTAVASLLCIASVSAAEDFWLEEELPFVDIRLGYGFAPKPDSYNVDVAFDPLFGGGYVTLTDTVDSDSATTLSYSIVGGTIDPLGVLFGAEAVYAFDSQEFVSRTLAGVPVATPADPTSLQYQTIGGNLLCGAGLALGRNVHIELLGVLGIGAMDLDFANGASTNNTDGEGWFWNAGVRGGIYFTYRRFVIGGLVEWSSMEYKAEANWADSVTTVEDTITGVGGRIEIGYHIP
jgi:hypothetical protein